MNYYKIIFITSKKIIIKNKKPPSTFPRDKQLPQVATKQNDLAVHDKWEACVGQPNRNLETILVNHGVQ